MQLSKINEGLLCTINCDQNEKNGQKGHKTALNSQTFSVEKVYKQLNLHSVVSNYTDSLWLDR